MATTSWAENAALATDRQPRMQADAVRLGFGLVAAEDDRDVARTGKPARRARPAVSPTWARTPLAAGPAMSITVCPARVLSPTIQPP